VQSNVTHYSVSTIAVVGLGKIGLPLAVQYTRSGRTVIGCDINPEVVEKVNAGQSHIHEEPELAEEADLRTCGSELPMLILPRYARRINDAMAEYAVHRIEVEIGSLAQQSVLILGVAYRGNVRETAFTSASLLRDALLHHDAKVYVDDPLFSEEELYALGYNPLITGLEDEIKAIILQADHKAYQRLDFSQFKHCQAVLDGRYALRREMIESLKMRYITVGDGNYPGPMREDSEGETDVEEQRNGKTREGLNLNQKL
jgi:UDP-N-acetyl-D-mannosaminuronate dehydrogenase